MGHIPVLFPFTHITTHYSLIILSLDALELQLMKGWKGWIRDFSRDATISELQYANKM